MPLEKYSRTINELYNLQQFAIKQGLDNIQQLSKYLNYPEKGYSVLHVAGTNGKGSTSIMIQQILCAHGLRTGLYTSPHLMDFRERIRIDSELIDHKYIIEYWDHVSNLVLKMKATFFDTTTAMAFAYFRDQAVDVAVIETGLGGRLDSTNIVNSEAAIITPIHRDHTKQLGTKLGVITREKADIIKENSTVFCGKQHHRVYQALQDYHGKGRAWFYLTKSVKANVEHHSYSGSQFTITDLIRNTNIPGINLNLAGRHQVENAALAYLTSRWYLQKRNIKFDVDKFKGALAGVQWPGRFQLVSKEPNVIFDVSHNLDGFRQTLKLINTNFNRDQSHLLVGLLDDKEYKAIAKLISQYFNSIVITEPGHERPLSPENLKSQLKHTQMDIKIIREPVSAFEYAYNHLKKNDTLFVMGSHFLIGALSEAIAKRT